MSSFDKLNFAIDNSINRRSFFFDRYALCNHDVETEEEYKKDLDNLFHLFTREKM